jgi:hypothetical protein
MNKKKRISFGFLLLILLSISYSCSSVRKTIKEPLKEQGTEYLINNLKTNELIYDNLSAKFAAQFIQGKKETQLTGQIRLLKDSIIWVSISPLLGIEMLRINITNDSLTYINRMESTYFNTDFDYINKLINSSLDFNMLQSFLTGNDFSDYDNSSFKSGIDNKEYTLVTSNRRKIKKGINENNIPIQHIWLDPETFKINRVMIRELAAQGRKVEATYKYETLNEKPVPVSINFEIETNDKKATINIQYSKIVINEELQFPFKIPEKYNRVNNLQ